MANVERRREILSSLPGPDYWKQRAEEGWKLVAIEWQRQAETGMEQAAGSRHQVPFGLRVADDCQHLEEDSREKEALTLMLELIVNDNPLSIVAEELNRRGFRTREGKNWSPASVFNMHPRLIEWGPGIVTSPEWRTRRGGLARR